MVGSSDERLLSFFKRLKNSDENSLKQTPIEANIETLNMSGKKAVDGPKPKRRKGLRR
ncbi:hypothetical protein D3C86_1197200 [compost metagenome]